MSSPINQKSLPERTADAIAVMLNTENYSVGAKLPNELQMAKQFEVSRSTIRQAEKLLAEQGILEIERGAGVFVSGKLGAENDPLGFSLVYDKQKLAHDLLELRLMIEPKAAALAAQNVRSKDIQLLYKLCDELELLVRSGQNYLKKDMEFHQAIANCSENYAVYRMIPYIHQMQLLHESITPERHLDATVAEHRKIADAIAHRRASDAFDAMQYHLMVIRSRIDS